MYLMLILMAKKRRLVAGGHKALDVEKNDFSGVVFIEAFRVAFVLTAIIKLDVFAADVSTSFLYEKTREQLYVITEKKFGDHEGKRMLLDKGLYGLQSVTGRFHGKLAST